MKTLVLFLAAVSHGLNSFQTTIPPLPLSGKEEAIEPSILVDREGNMIATWTENEVVYVSELPLNGNWSLPFALSNYTDRAFSSYIHLDSDGKPFIVWMEEKGVKKAKKIEIGTWVVTQTIPTLMVLPEKNRQEEEKNPPLLGLIPNEDFEKAQALNDALQLEGLSNQVLSIKKTNIKLPLDADETLDKSPYLPEAIVGNAIDAPTTSALSGMNVGYAAGTLAPTGGAIISAVVGIGTSSPNSGVANLHCSGTKTTTSGGNIYGILWDGTLAPAAGAAGEARGISSEGTFTAPTGQTIASAAGVKVNVTPNPVGNMGTITNLYGLLVGPGTAKGAGTITNGYGGYFSAPNYGDSLKFALYTDNFSIGYTVFTPPTNGAIISGRVGIATVQPTTLLTIGTVNTTLGECILVNGNNTSTQMGFYNNTLRQGYIGTGTLGAGFIVNATESPLALQSKFIMTFTTNSTEAMRIDSSQRVGIGTSGPDTNSLVTNSITNSNLAISEYITGTTTSTATNPSGIYIDRTISYSAGNSLVLTGVNAAPTFKTSSGTLSGDNACFIANPQTTGNAGTISNLYGYKVLAGSSAGTVTNSYGGYFQNLAAGSTKIALYTDNLSIGYATTAPPTNGAIISGQVGIGTSSLSTTTNNTLQVGAIGTVLQYSQGLVNTFYRMREWYNNNDIGLGVNINSLNTYDDNTKSAWVQTFGPGSDRFRIHRGASGNTGVQPTVLLQVDSGGGLNIGYSTTTAPTQGAIISGQFSAGSSTINSTIYSQFVPSSAYTYGTSFTGTLTARGGAQDAIGIYLTPSLIGPSSSTQVSCKGMYIAPTFTAGSVTTLYFIGLQIAGDQMTGTGTAPTYGFAEYINMPAYGASKYGTFLAGSASVASGQLIHALEVSAQIGASSGTVDNCRHIYVYPSHSTNSATVSTAIGLHVDTGTTAGTINNGYSGLFYMPAYGTNKFGLVVSATGTIAAGNTMIGLYVLPDLGCSSGTLASVWHHYISPIHNSNTATISNAYGLYIDGGTTAGTITNGYSLYVLAPAYGTAKYTAVFTGSTSSIFIDSTGLLYPSANKGINLGGTANRFNTIFYVTATTGTSRLAKSKTVCEKCNVIMMCGTGTTYTLGEEADYIPVFCKNCGNHKVEAVKHLPKERLLQRRSPEKIEFLGFKVCQYSGNSRGIQVMFNYGEKLDNSTYFSDAEFEEFSKLSGEEQRRYIYELGLREWYALEEVRLMEEECKQLQSQLDGIGEKWRGTDLLKD
jgi:hypothetical protein